MNLQAKALPFLQKFSTTSPEGKERLMESHKAKLLEFLSVPLTSFIVAFDTIGMPNVIQRKISQSGEETNDSEWKSQGYEDFFPQLKELIEFCLNQKTDSGSEFWIAGNHKEDRLKGPETNEAIPENESTKEYLQDISQDVEKNNQLDRILQNAILLDGKNEDEKINQFMTEFSQSDKEKMVIFCSREHMTATQLRIKLFELKNPDYKNMGKKIKIIGIPRNVTAQTLEVWYRNSSIGKVFKFLKNNWKEFVSHPIL